MCPNKEGSFMQVEYIRSALKLVPASLYLPWLISIDGDQGAGKTTLAKEIGSQFGGVVVDVDEYLLRNGSPYLEQVRWAELTQVLQRNKDDNLIISGVLLEYVMGRMQIIPTYRIFMRHCMNGSWDYLHWVNHTDGLPHSRLSREIVSYYRSIKPWMRADEEVTLFGHHVHDPSIT